MSRREADIFTCVVDTIVAPAPPLPPVRETDTVEAFERWLAAGPRTNRIALRGMLLALGALRLRRMPADRRLAFLQRAPRDLVDPLRALAAMSYYGDPAVSKVVR